VSAAICVYDDTMRRSSAVLGARRRRFVRLSWFAVFVLGLLAPARASAFKAIFLVRHAEKASSTDPDTPLAPQGADRSVRLANLLRNAGVTHVFVTDRKRTQQTAQALVEQRHLAPAVVLSSQQPAQMVDALKAVPRDAVVLAVGHSNTIPLVLKGLGVNADVTIRDDEYGRVFLLTPDLRLVELAY
jgi:phosphohistidine phosphatase SixA